MLEIKKRKTEFGYHFEITTEEGSFDFFYGGTLDLYWRCRYQGSILKSEDTKTFFITKENYFLFQLFDELYHGVKNCEVFSKNNQDDEIYFNDREWQEYLVKKEQINSERLFLNNRVEWHCDDSCYEEASTFVIEKMNDVYKLTFKMGMVDNFFTYTVRIRNSGSRYSPFNVLFMKMYQQLCEYESDYHQVHIEEYLYHKKLVKKKENI